MLKVKTNKEHMFSVNELLKHSLKNIVSSNSIKHSVHYCKMKNETRQDNSSTKQQFSNFFVVHEC